MLSTVIMDVDGTLLDTNYLHVEAFVRAFADVNLQFPRREIHRQIGKGADLLLPEFVADPEVRSEVNRRHGVYYQALQDAGYLLPGASELVRSLAERELRVFLATSAKPDQMPGIMATLGVGDVLSGVVNSGEVDESKPEPDIFQLALRRAGCSPDEAVVVGDTVWDVEAATKAGLRAVCVLTGGAFSRRELEEAGALAVFADCAEMLAARFPEGF